MAINSFVIGWENTRRVSPGGWVMVKQLILFAYQREFPESDKFSQYWTGKTVQVLPLEEAIEKAFIFERTQGSNEQVEILQARNPALLRGLPMMLYAVGHNPADRAGWGFYATDGKEIGSFYWNEVVPVEAPVKKELVIAGEGEW